MTIYGPSENGSKYAISTAHMKHTKNAMKPPYASPIPYLMDLDPTAPFEFQFLAEEMTWDPTMDFPTFTTTADKLAKYRPKEYYPPQPNPTRYQIDFTDIADKEDCRHSPREEDEFISKLNSTLAKAAPKNVYKRQKLSMKRKRSRKKRKKMTTSDSDIEPEFSSIWTHSTVGDLFALSPVFTTTQPTTNPRESLDTEPPAADTMSPSLFPQVDWTQVNSRSLKNLPEPEYFPVSGCYPIDGPVDPDKAGIYSSSYSSYKTDQHGRPTDEAPYKRLRGFLTEDGVIPHDGHDQAIHGYVWSDLYDKWVLVNMKRGKEESRLGLRTFLPPTPPRRTNTWTTAARTSTPRTPWPRMRGH